MEKVSHVATKERLSNRNLWTFTAGGIGRDMAYSLWNGSLLICIMYTKSVNPKQLSIIMIMMALCRVFDAVNDPIMGGIIERTRTKWGKFKPWVFIGAITNALVTFAIFAAPLKGWDFVIFFPFAYLLWDITFTMNDIGYWAMLPSLTSNDEDRNKLSTWANILAGIGAGIAGIIIPMFTIGDYAIGGTAVVGFIVTAAIIGICFVGCQTMTCCCVKEKPLAPLDGSEKIGIKEMFKVIFKNKQLLWIALVMIFYNLGSSLYFASTTNFIYFRFGYQGGNASIFGTLGGLLGGISILYPILAKRFSRKKITFFSIILAIIGYVLMFIVGTTTMNASNTTAIFIGLILSSSIIVCGQTMFYMVQTISIANTIEYNEWKTGSRDEGIIFSVRPFMAKMGSALVAVVQLFVYGVYRGSNGMKIADYTNGISDLENAATTVLANESEIVTSGGVAAQADTAQAAFQTIVDKAGVTFETVKGEIVSDKLEALYEAAQGGASPTAEQIAEASTAKFGEVVGQLKAIAIDNTLSTVDKGSMVWMLFCLTVVPMIFVIIGYIIWAKKYKIDETMYAEMVNEIEARREASEEQSNAEENFASEVEIAAEVFAEVSAPAEKPVTAIAYEAEPEEEITDENEQTEEKTEE